MRPNNEWYYERFPIFKYESGGTASGLAFNGGSVVESRYGEFCSRLGEFGELMVEFIDRGIICGYLETGELAFICLDVGVFFDSLEDKNFELMVNRGDDILDLVSDLDYSGRALFLTILTRLGSLKVDLAEGEKFIATDEVEDCDFDKGYSGILSLGGINLPYQITNRGDEFVLAIGEMNSEARTVFPISVSHQVDFIDELATDDPKRFWKLADKILLNS